MGEIELVIKIPEEIYKLCQEKELLSTHPYKVTIWNAVANGIPLPKGHGRIADMDEAIECIEEVNGEDAIWAISLINWACGKRTVLEADEEKN